jgi:phospholipid transport system substrate-binding protein
MRSLVPVTVAAVFCLALGAPAVAQGQTATATLKKWNTQVDKLLKKKTAKGSAQEQKVKDEIRAIVTVLLDFDELAQQTMKRHWKEMSATQQADFTKVFRDLLERHYVKQIRGGVDYGMSYKGEKVDGDRARVKTVIRTKRRGRMTETVVEYLMLRRDGTWRVWDIITDEDEYNSLVKIYRSDFNKIWSKDGFAGVMKKMRNKLAEPEK